MTEEIITKNPEETISRREQFLDKSFEEWDLDITEKEIFGFVAQKPWSEKRLDRWLREQGIKIN